jgi:hypothetical protein
MLRYVPEKQFRGGRYTSYPQEEPLMLKSRRDILQNGLIVAAALKTGLKTENSKAETTAALNP